ncbi:FAD-dependent oxidoreductase [Mucilaginibacter daejeonensis]|uniref:FAD-dependent oxidoreductase n=1 Tax=Mucilaginibacter daejeonensis TaxID=398049 RepID=UPI001D170833|nr:FAD-dependent oxidoreductase [Mucilaginibacter daejeonensis]UEG54851.1 FAD-dependent oxidoreductase [Mucilaginibacter daejeonensis]
MSGRPFYKRSQLLSSINRRSFLLRAGLSVGGVMLQNCVSKVTGHKQAYAHIKGKLNGPNHKAGHILRDKLQLPVPTESRTVKTLIVGSGISGLSAARWLKKQGEHNFEVLELENHAGGNAYYGSNAVSKYPLGAHYLPIVNNDDGLLIEFLQQHNIITGFNDKRLPFYNEYYLCFDPEERLLINGEWQEGLVPDFGVPTKDKQQIDRFFKLINTLKQAKGKDDRYAFTLPLDESSTDNAYRKLDQISFKDYLKTYGFTSEHLLWYLDYCCKDDYGVLSDKVSAWAGLHYFAARKGKAANAEDNAVLTWPEGNGWLMSRLRDEVTEHIKTNQMAYAIKPDGNRVAVTVYDIQLHQTITIYADKVIMASPQFVNQRLLKGTNRPGIDYKAMHYSPWLIANLTVDSLPYAKGVQLCWDNVAYNTPSVGYVNANQQSVSMRENKKVLTYYLPLCNQEPRVSRLAAYARTYEQWLDIIIPEMEKLHLGITPHIEEAELWLWGHGMISPAVNYIWGGMRTKARQPINNQIFFAHTDLSGISVFEEAFHQGIQAATQVLEQA